MQILEQLERHGLLMQQDKTLPSVTRFITGESLSGSWWSHERAHEIFGALELLSQHEDVLFVKLISGKVTLVHRRLWPALIAVAKSRQSWQTKRLSTQARTLLKELGGKSEILASGPAARELQERLLVQAHEAHTEGGAHKVVLQRWEEWERKQRFESSLDPREGKRILEEAIHVFGGKPGSLPWHRF